MTTTIKTTYFTNCNNNNIKCTSQSRLSSRINRLSLSSLLLLHLLLINYSLSHVSSMDLANVKYVEQGNARLIATSPTNYAIASPKLVAKGWVCVSVNNNQFTVMLPAGSKKVATVTNEDEKFITSLRDEMSSSNTNTIGSSTNGFGTNMMFNSNSNSGFSSSSSSFSSSSGGGTNSFMSSGSDGALSVMWTDENNFSVSKTNFPYNYSRLFFNNDLVTKVYKDGKVIMKSIQGTEQSPEERDYLVKLKDEVKGMHNANLMQANNMVQNTFGSVASMLNGIMSGLPKPPDFSSSMGGIFGNNFPFGNNNSPFSSSSGFPFGSGAGGAGAFAFAGRR